MSGGIGEPEADRPRRIAQALPERSRLLQRSRLLLIDTCGMEGTLALAEQRDNSWAPVALERLPGRSASERLLPTLRRMMDRLGWKIGELAAVAVVHGPGSFTGLRVGVSAAKGLCEGGGMPLIAISRLSVLADAAGEVTERVHALLDAGRGEVFHGAFLDGRCEREELLTAQAAMERIGAGKGPVTVVVCEPRMEAALAGIGARLLEEPTAAGALKIATARLRAEEFADVAALDGNYLRRTEMEIRQRVGAHEQARSGHPVG